MAYAVNVATPKSLLLRDLIRGIVAEGGPVTAEGASARLGEDRVRVADYLERMVKAGEAERTTRRGRAPHYYPIEEGDDS